MVIAPNKKDPILQSLSCPLISLALLVATGILPWFTFPALSLPSSGSILKLPALYDGILNSEVALDGKGAIVSLTDMFAGIQILDVVGIIVSLLACALLLLAALIFGIIAIVRAIRANMRKAIGSSKVAILLLALAQLIGILSIFAVNARLTGELNRILASQGIAEMPVTIIAPSLFIEVLLGVTVLCFVIFTIIGSRLRHL